MSAKELLSIRHPNGGSSSHDSLATPVHFTADLRIPLIFLHHLLYSLRICHNIESTLSKTPSFSSSGKSNVDTMKECGITQMAVENSLNFCSFGSFRLALKCFVILRVRGLGAVDDTAPLPVPSGGCGIGWVLRTNTPPMGQCDVPCKQESLQSCNTCLSFNSENYQQHGRRRHSSS